MAIKSITHKLSAIHGDSIMVATELRKFGRTQLPNGGQLTKRGKAAVYEAMLSLRVVVPMETVNSLEDRPIIVFMESLTGIKNADLVQKLATLTQREFEVFEAVSMGERTQAAADELGLAASTLAIHRAMAIRKLKTKGINALVHSFWMYRICNEFHPDMLKAARHKLLSA